MPEIPGDLPDGRSVIIRARNCKSKGVVGVIVTHDVRGVRLVPGARGVTSLMMTDDGAAVVERLGDPGGVGGRWSFGPHNRVGRDVGINFSRQRWIVRFA